MVVAGFSKEKMAEKKQEYAALEMGELENKIKNTHKKLQMMQDAYFSGNKKEHKAIAKFEAKAEADARKLVEHKFNLKKLQTFHDSFVAHNGDLEMIKKDLKNGGDALRQLFDLYERAKYSKKELEERTNKRKKDDEAEEDDEEVTINKKKKTSPATPKTTTSSSSTSPATKSKTPTTSSKSGDKTKTPSTSSKSGDKTKTPTTTSKSKSGTASATKKVAPPPASSSDDE